jgi:hypothetical protein
VIGCKTKQNKTKRGEDEFEEKKLFVGVVVFCFQIKKRCTGLVYTYGI